MTDIKKAWNIFESSIADYHELDDVDSIEKNPYKLSDIQQKQILNQIIIYISSVH